MLPEIRTTIPGKESQSLAARLAKVECRNTIYIDEDWPIFWERAEGANVWDVDGNRFLDMTSGFGVAGLGYGFTAKAMQQQSQQLMHAMGDVHPARVKAELCEKLSEITFERWEGKVGKSLLGNSGFEAVEAALKTAVLATGRSEIVSFQGGYHGLGYGALLGQGIRWFSEPFENQLASVTQRLAFPQKLEDLLSLKEDLQSVNAGKVGAMLVEPIQGRGGIIVPPKGFLKMLREWCDTHGVVLIFDEIYTGFWRTGLPFACEHDEVIPDLICLGKALSGGFPISACVGKAEVMDRWPETSGEALHTSTFLGNPVGCAMSLSAISQYQSHDFETKVPTVANYLRVSLESLLTFSFVNEVRGRGLMLGIQMDSGNRVINLVKQMLQKGVIALPDGPNGDVLALTPPYDVSEAEIDKVIEIIRACLQENEV